MKTATMSFHKATFLFLSLCRCYCWLLVSSILCYEGFVDGDRGVEFPLRKHSSFNDVLDGKEVLLVKALQRNNIVELYFH